MKKAKVMQYKRNGRNPSRASIRLHEKLQHAAGINVDATKRRPCLRISRTVELVNQANEKWRDEKSKLLFMVGIGLTPIANSNGLVLPSILIPNIPATLLDEVKNKYELARQARLKEAGRIERLRKFEKMRSWRIAHCKQTAGPVEVIDLSSDDDFKEEVSDSAPSFIFSEYPNLRIDVSSTSSNSLHQHKPKSSNGSNIKKPPQPHNFAAPTVIKRVAYAPISKSGVKQTPSSLLHRHKYPSHSNYTLPSISSRTADFHKPVKSCIYIAPSPPMEVTQEEVISISANIKRRTSSLAINNPKRYGFDAHVGVDRHALPDTLEDDIIIVD